MATGTTAFGFYAVLQHLEPGNADDYYYFLPTFLLSIP